MAAINPSGQYQQLHGKKNYPPPTSQYPLSSRFAEQDYDSYEPYQSAELKRLEEKDSNMKYRIRMLRVVSRILAVILSIAVVVPLALTLAKFLQTRNNTSSNGSNGEKQPIWPNNPNTVYIYVYFGVSTLSLLLNAMILASYLHGVRRANYAATIGQVWTTIVIVGNLAVWIAAVAIYRYGKHKVDDKWKDLWGWTCSSTAGDLQPLVGELNYEKYCHIQDAAYYAGLIQIGSNLLTLIIVILMIMRTRTKKKLQNYQLDDAKEPLRG